MDWVDFWSCSSTSFSPMRRIFVLAFGMMLISKSFCFTMRKLNNNRCVNFRLNASLPSEPSHSALPFSLAQESVERELNRALEYARLMDKQYGICTDPSRNAWDAVDTIYERMQASHTKHSSQPTTRNQEQSSGRVSRRKQLHNGPIQNQALYFFWWVC